MPSLLLSRVLVGGLGWIELDTASALMVLWAGV